MYIVITVYILYCTLLIYVRIYYGITMRELTGMLGALVLLKRAPWSNTPVTC